MNKKTGFTLFELLVSISIIAILTALATISYGAMQVKARDARRVQDMQSIQKAEEQYYMIHSAVYDLGQFATGRQWTDLSGNVIFVFPSDPKGSAAGWTDYSGNAGVSDATKYCACAKLETATGNASDSNCTWSSGGSYYCVYSQQ
jgi:prepilin-type N-terminal cleavage/methylation domain-containing protein